MAAVRGRGASRSRPDGGGRSTVYGTRGAVACEHPQAALAGVRALDAGGNAADACVAIPTGGAQLIRVLENGVRACGSDPRKDGCALAQGPPDGRP